MNAEDVKLLEELFIQEGILFDPPSSEDSEIEDLTLQIISSLQEALEKLTSTVDEVRGKCTIIFFSPVGTSPTLYQPTHIFSLQGP